jgi:hypothetical protein
MAGVPGTLYLTLPFADDFSMHVSFGTAEWRQRNGTRAAANADL